MDKHAMVPTDADTPDAMARYHWLPILAVQPGMVTARAVVGLAGNLETMFVAAGVCITLATIEQMLAKGVDCVAVLIGPGESADSVAGKLERYQDRLGQIFGPTPNAACEPLLNALLAGAEVLC